MFDEAMPQRFPPWPRLQSVPIRQWCQLAVLAAVGTMLPILPAHGQSTPPSWPYEMQVDVFHIHSDFKFNDPQQLEEILLHLRGDIAGMLSLEPPLTPMHVVLFGSAQEYSRYMKHYFPAIAPRRAIFLQDRGPGMLFTYWHDDLATDLRHEAAHAILNQTGAQLPLWLDEGLAEYFEVPRDQRYSQCPYLRQVIDRSVSGQVPSLILLERVARMDDFSEAHYRDSWAWVHFLLHRRESTRQLLIDFVARVHCGTPQPPLSRQLAPLIGDPRIEFQEHFANLQVAERLTAQPAP